MISLLIWEEHKKTAADFDFCNGPFALRYPVGEQPTEKLAPIFREGIVFTQGKQQNGVFFVQHAALFQLLFDGFRVGVHQNVPG